MAEFKNDQAAGLRRIMAAPKPRVVSIIAASATQDQSRMIINLAVSIHHQGNDVLIVQASHASREANYEIAEIPTLLEVSTKSALLEHAIKNTSHNVATAKLLQKNQVKNALESDLSTELNLLFDELSNQYEIILIDATLNNEDLLPLKTLNESEIIIQLTRDPESIKDAYTVIKQVCAQLGRRTFGIIVDNATEAQAQVVFKNISQVARRFMQIELEYFGAIPSDDHLSRAAKLGRSVIDAFPLTPASSAFKRIAQRMDCKSRQSNIDQSQVSSLH